MIFGSDDIERPHAADQLLLGIAEQPGQEGIDESEALVLQDKDADLGGRHRRPEHCLLIAHRHRVVC